MKFFIRVNEKVSSWSRVKLDNEYININLVTFIKFKDQEVELWVGDARNNQIKKYIVTDLETIEKITDFLF